MTEIHFLKNIIFVFVLISIFSVIYTRKWSIEELIQNVHEWNYLNDPEELITDKNLGPKIHTSYLLLNHVYEKTDINLFYISDVIEKYIYHRREFVSDLYEAMLNSTEINKQSMKKHHLFLVIFRKYKELVIFGSSPELNRLLPIDKVLQIEMEIKRAMGNPSNNPPTIIYLIFDKLQQLWKKHTINKFKQSNQSSSSSINLTTVKEFLTFCSSFVILFLFIYVLCCRKKKEKKD